MAKRTSRQDPARMLAIEAARIAEDDKTEDIVVLDLRSVSPVTSYFVIGTGSSDRQMRTVADDVAEYGRKVGQPVWHVAGQQSGEWIVMDFVDVVVHLFDPSHRRYYDLELIWGESPRVRWRRPRRRKAKPTK
ncbi:MAG: ribosome silencing factor [Phycisphaerae bacterium]